MLAHLICILTTGLVNCLALAIPMDIAKNIADTLVKQGYIKRGYLGISSQLVRLPDAQRARQTQEHGLLIIKVDDNSHAEQGRLMLSDILVEPDGDAKYDTKDLKILL